MISREEYLSSTDIVDLSSALEGVGGDFESYLSVLKVYCEVGQETAEKIEQYYESKDYLKLRIEVHGLKSSSYVIGAKKFGDLSKKMEFYCRDIENDSDIDEALAGLAEGIPVLLSMYSEIIDKLSVVFVDSSEIPYEDRKLGINLHKEGTVVADCTCFENKMAEAVKALSEFDLDTLDSIIKELSDMKLDPIRMKTVKDIIHAASMYDYDLVEQLLRSF